jgi:hypothetical protein
MSEMDKCEPLREEHVLSVLILVFWVVIPHELHCFGGTDYLPHQG